MKRWKKSLQLILSMTRQRRFNELWTNEIETFSFLPNTFTFDFPSMFKFSFAELHTNSPERSSMKALVLFPFSFNWIAEVESRLTTLFSHRNLLPSIIHNINKRSANDFQSSKPTKTRNHYFLFLCFPSFLAIVMPQSSIEIFADFNDFWVAFIICNVES